jgi:hypothetical protein
MSKVGKIRAKLIELWRRETPYKSTDNIFWNGEDNNYSEEIERVVQSSPTGVRAYTMMSKFIFGDGISELEDVEFPNGVLLSEVVKDVVDDVAIQGGSFIHVSYGINEKGMFVPVILKSLDYNKCRISKPDDEGNEGMIMVKNFNKFDPSIPREKQNGSMLFYPFSDNQNVIKAQIKADAKKKKIDSEDWTELIQHYRGQVLYLNLTPKYRYALSKFDSVYNDLDSEARISTYINTMVRKGFIGKTVVLTQGLDEEQSEQIYEDIAEWLGSENASQAYHMDVEQAVDLSQVLRVEQVKSQFDYQQFDLALKTIRRNILGVANNLPEGLAFSDQNALYAGSGESYKQLKQIYWEQNSWEREKIETAFWKLGFIFKFKPIIKESTIDDNNTSN